MTFSRLAAMERYWANNPPVHVLVRAFVGFKPEAKRDMNDDGTLEEFMAEMATLNG